MNHCLIVVSRNRPDLVLELRQAYPPGVGVDIILDRRQQQRWMWPGEDAIRPSSRTDLDLQRQGFAVVARPWVLRRRSQLKQGGKDGGD